MATNKTHKLTNGDLDGMDAGQLREHILEYRLANGVVVISDDEYVTALVDLLAHELDIPMWETRGGEVVSTDAYDELMSELDFEFDEAIEWNPEADGE